MSLKQLTPYLKTALNQAIYMAKEKGLALDPGEPYRWKEMIGEYHVQVEIQRAEPDKEKFATEVENLLDKKEV